MAPSVPSTSLSVSFFEELSIYLRADLTGVEEKICTQLSHIPLINQISHHLAQGGGKRIRPILTLLCARLSHYQGQQHIDMAAAMELIHMATLLHDDVIDHGTHRRSIPCAHTLWGNQVTILVGDYLFSHAFQTMLQSNSLPILKSLADAATAMAEGEMLQLSISGDLSISQETYFKVIRLKTASLFSSACTIGSLIGTGHHREVLAKYGLELGILFQLVDDLLDYHLHSNSSGKTSKSDLQEKKITLPLLWLYEQATPLEKHFLNSVMKAAEVTPEHITQVTQLMHTYKIHHQLMHYIKDHCGETQHLLDSLPPSIEKSFLGRLADFCAERVY